MRLRKARVQKYRSIRDSGWFDVEEAKTILVGPNEAGKTVLLEALQQLNPPDGVRRLEPLRDYPRSEYNDITTGKVRPESVTVVEGHFALDDADKGAIPAEFRSSAYVCGRNLDNKTTHRFEPEVTRSYGDVKKDLIRLAAHATERVPAPAAGAPPPPNPNATLSSIVDAWPDQAELIGDRATSLKDWLEKQLPLVDEANEDEGKRYDRLMDAITLHERRESALQTLWKRLPVFVRFTNYFRVRPSVHLEHLAHRVESKALDDDSYDYGNLCLLRLLGFSPRELSNLGKASDPPAGNKEAIKNYKDQLDNRSYQLNAASVRLTQHIRAVWQPDPKRAEAEKLRIVADGQYLRVVVEDDLGVEVELDQRSEGFQWLVSFFVVFFAEAVDKHKNAILLLDEPGLSLHGLKQRDFRETISRLAESNQTVYTTHSPFLVGPNELDLVRVVEMTDRVVGTQVHTNVTAGDPAALLPLQEALGYDLAQSLFAQQRNLVLEGLTDEFYLDSVANLLREAGDVQLNEKIALVTAASAGKVVYFATILHAQKLKVAALLDSDAAGDQAAKQEVLIHKLGNKGILRTRDAYDGPVTTPEVEDMLRASLVRIAKDLLGWDVAAKAAGQPARPIIDLFSDEVPDFSKYKLAKAFVRWTRDHAASDLTDDERRQWRKLIENINAALR